MKKFLAIIVPFALCASDPITLDSMFKNQQGLRSITTLQTLSSGNSNSFSTYPGITATDEGRAWADVKIVSLSQTFLYDVGHNIDMLIAANGSMKRREYVDFTSGYGSENSTDFDSLWVGGTYGLETIGSFKPELTFQAALHQKERYAGKTSNHSLKSFSAKVSLKNYSDPVISTLFVGTLLNQNKKIGESIVNNGNSFMAGFDLSVVLSPKISLDFGVEQSYQTESYINNIKSSNTSMLSTLSIGATYSINAKMSLAVSSSMGGSSQSPDSILSVSLWQKF